MLCLETKKTYPLLVTKHTMSLDIEAKRRIRLMKQNEPIEEKKQEKEEIKSLLEEIIREGARKLLQAAIEHSDLPDSVRIDEPFCIHRRPLRA